MTTIKEIAKTCNVSVATVSNILNGKPGASPRTRELVLNTAKELNYTPNYVAINLKMRSTKSIGVIAEDMTIFSIPDIIDGITDSCEKHGYHILLSNMRLYKKYSDTYYNGTDYFGLVEEVIKDLMRKQVEGIIYVSAHERLIKCLPEDLDIPAIMAYGYSKSQKIPSIIVDDEKGAYELINYAVKMGHEKIGVITGKVDSFHMQARLIGYQKALLENQIVYKKELVCEGEWDRISGYKYTDELIEKGVTAIFCMNDLMAGGVYDRLEERNMKPGEDMSILGYDNRELSTYYKPPLTTTNLPLHDIGYCASEVMMEMLHRDNAEGEVKSVYQLPCSIQIRNSVKKI
jgi:LacI family transcriptional regulator